MKNKSKQNVLWILIAVLALLLIAFFILKNGNEKKEKKEEQKAETSVVHIYNTDGLQKFSYEDGEGNTMGFEKEKDAWKYSGDTSVPLAETALLAMETTFSDITAVKEITKPDALKDYGLDSPAYKLRLTGEDGKEVLLLIGTQAGDNYYIMREEDEKIYTAAADVITQMVWDVKTLIQKENFASVTENNFVKETIIKPDGTQTVFDSSDDTQEDAVTAVAQGFSGFYFTDCEDYHVTEDTLSKYGLDDENRTKVVLTYNETNNDGDTEEKEITFYIGTKESTGTYYYVQLDDSQMVNTVMATSVDAVLGGE